MIRVEMAPEPPSFDEKVRQPGLSAIAELVGEAPLLSRGGPRRKKVAQDRGAIPAAHYPPYWRKALDDLLTAYRRICAYTCIYIERVTGAPSVDHMIPKSLSWDQVYEWGNYRLACSWINSRKGAIPQALDPFEIEDGWFALELVGFHVVPAAKVDTDIRNRIDATIDLLGLNEPDCKELREEYAEDYWVGLIHFDYLRRRAPFVARELKRQGRLREGDSEESIDPVT